MQKTTRYRIDPHGRHKFSPPFGRIDHARGVISGPWAENEK
jgi:hypothetical protein